MFAYISITVLERKLLDHFPPNYKNINWASLDAQEEFVNTIKSTSFLEKHFYK